jgi:hypothetical protein
MYVCTSMYVCMYVCTYRRAEELEPVHVEALSVSHVYVCMYVCTSMYVCMYVHIVKLWN